jgi:hypothetical protein
MPIRVKQSGAWSAPINDGNLRVRSGGSWIAANNVKVSSGGGWVDSGVHGFPAQPVNATVTKTPANLATFVWTPGVGGTPVVSYHVRIDRQFFGTIADQYPTGTSATFSMLPGHVGYTFYVQGISASGLAGPYSVGAPMVSA